MKGRPKQLYKYYHPDRVDVLESGKISYSPPDRYNDPFDSNPAVILPTDDEYLEKTWRWLKADMPHVQGLTLDEWKHLYRTDTDRLTAELKAQLLKAWNENTGAYCLSSNSFDPLMLTHYADEHRGFVVEFDATHEFFVKRMAEVHYSGNRPIHKGPDDDVTGIWTTKATCWGYENEWRSLEILGGCERRTIQRGGQNVTIFLRPFPKEAVTKVTCGCRMPRDQVNNLRFNLREWGYSCLLEQALLDLHTYSFTFEDFPLL